MERIGCAEVRGASLAIDALHFVQHILWHSRGKVERVAPVSVSVIGGMLPTKLIRTITLR
mgnify:CR=1 FL=1